MTSLDPIEYAQECVESMRKERDTSSLSSSHKGYFDLLLHLSTRANGAAMGANACHCYDVARVFHDAADEFLHEADRVLQARVLERKKGVTHVPQDP